VLVAPALDKVHPLVVVSADQRLPEDAGTVVQRARMPTAEEGVQVGGGGEDVIAVASHGSIPGFEFKVELRCG
jgi:hypothetical protein